MQQFVKLLFLAQVECENYEEFLPRILGLSEDTKTLLAETVEDLRQDPRVDYVAGSLGDPQEPQEAVNDLQNQIVINKATIGDLEDQLNRATEREAQLMREIDNHRTKEESFRREMDSSKEVISRLETQIAEYVTKTESLSLIEVELEKTKAVLKLWQAGNEKLLSVDDVGLYRQSISELEGKLVSLETQSSENITKLRGELHLLEQEKEELHRDFVEAKRSLEQAKIEAENKEKELGQFIMTGGALGGQLRDRIIRTLQEQVIVRDEELEMLKQQRMDLHEENKKGERFLVSAVHAIALRYHEEMVQRFQENDLGRVNRQESPEDFYSQEYNNS